MYRRVRRSHLEWYRKPTNSFCHDSNGKGGRMEWRRVGPDPNLLLCMWIYTKAEDCDGRGRSPLLNIRHLLDIIMNCCLWSDWAALAPSSAVFSDSRFQTNLNREFVNNGTKVLKVIETVQTAIELTCNNMAFDATHTPRACFFRAVSILLSYAPDRDWELAEEMEGGCRRKSVCTALRWRWKSIGWRVKPGFWATKFWSHLLVWLVLMHFVCLTAPCSSIDPLFEVSY